MSFDTAGAGCGAYIAPQWISSTLDEWYRMAKAATSFQLLYISRLARDCNFSVVKEIVEVARRSNPGLGITGALLFDGERFCQLLEGSEPDVRTLMSRIEVDPRHAHVKVLYAGASRTGVVMQRWASGYCDPHDLDELDTARETRPSAIDEFTAILKRADID